VQIAQGTRRRQAAAGGGVEEVSLLDGRFDVYEGGWLSGVGGSCTVGAGGGVSMFQGMTSSQQRSSQQQHRSQWQRVQTSVVQAAQRTRRRYAAGGGVEEVSLLDGNV
jgi:hypothetical protein